MLFSIRLFADFNFNLVSHSDLATRNLTMMSLIMRTNTLTLTSRQPESSLDSVLHLDSSMYLTLDLVHNHDFISELISASP